MKIVNKRLVERIIERVCAYSYLVYLLVSFVFSRLIFKTPCAKDQSKIVKVIIFDVAHIGDVVRTSPVIASLKSGFKDISVDMVVGEWAREVVALDGNINKLFFYNSYYYARDKKRTRLKEVFDLLKEIRKERYDLIIECSGDFITFLIQVLSHIRFRLDWQPKFFMENKLGKLSSVVDTKLSMLTELGLSTINSSPYFLITQEDMLQARALLCGKKCGASYFVISSGMSDERRSWDVIKYEELVSRLLAAYPSFSVVVLGNGKELEFGQELEKKHPERCYNLTGSTTLRVAGAVIKDASLFVCNDTGLLHIATALRANTVAIFGYTNPANVLNLLDRDHLTIVYDQHCEKKQRWAEELSVEKVYEKCVENLSSRGILARKNLPVMLES